MVENERLQKQRKNAVKTATWLFIVVIIIAIIYVIWFKTWIVNKVKANEALKGNNLSRIVEPDENKSLKPGVESSDDKK